ncbi:MAG: hypothetical protein EAY75_06290 [Bacteroidetes bacterium]|nr:MAG: hypothetical protein EAY75_06290 [Bacteroidota bacterium]
MVALALVVFVLAFKYVKIVAYRTRRNEKIPIHLFVNFHQIEVYGTDSPARRRFMEQCNRLTTYLWLSIVIFLFFLALPYIKGMLIN